MTATAALIYPRFRIGGSASRNDAPGARRDVVGGFGGFTVGRLTLFGEVDLISDTPDGGVKKKQFAAFAEGDLFIARGVNAKVTYGFLDPRYRHRGERKNQAPRRSRALSHPFLQISTFYTRLEDIPQSNTDLDRLGVELHTYF